MSIDLESAFARFEGQAELPLIARTSAPMRLLRPHHLQRAARPQPVLLANLIDPILIRRVLLGDIDPAELLHMDLENQMSRAGLGQPRILVPGWRPDTPVHLVTSCRIAAIGSSLSFATIEDGGPAEVRQPANHLAPAKSQGSGRAAIWARRIWRMKQAQGIAAAVLLVAVLVPLLPHDSIAHLSPPWDRPATPVSPIVDRGPAVPRPQPDFRSLAHHPLADSIGPVVEPVSLPAHSPSVDRIKTAQISSHAQAARPTVAPPVDQPRSAVTLASASGTRSGSLSTKANAQAQRRPRKAQERHVVDARRRTLTFNKTSAVATLLPDSLRPQ